MGTSSILHEDFWEAKADRFILVLECVRDTIARCVSNRVLMGFTEEYILELFEETN